MKKVPEGAYVDPDYRKCHGSSCSSDVHEITEQTVTLEDFSKNMTLKRKEKQP